jgi:hypothetical protein
MNAKMDNYLNRYNNHLLDSEEISDAREWLADIGYGSAANASDNRVIAYYVDNFYDGGLAGYIVASAAWRAFQARK